MSKPETKIEKTTDSLLIRLAASHVSTFIALCIFTLFFILGLIAGQHTLCK